MTRVVLMAPDDLPVPPVAGGSVQIYLQHLLPKLAEQPSLEPSLISPGRTPIKGIRHTVIPMRHEAYRKQAIRILRKSLPDVVQIENRPQWVPLVRRSVPTAKIVLNLHSLTFLGPGHINRRAAKAVLGDADAVTLNSDSLRRAIRKRFGLAASDWNPVVVHPGVPLHRFRPPRKRGSDPDEAQPSARDTVNFSATRPLRVLYVGRVIRQKGVHILIETIRLLRRKKIPVELTIIGKTPPWESAYAKLVRQRAIGLPIRFRGFVSPNQLPKEYWKADVLVCPSQGHEAFGLVNVEAMAAGLPVIASAQGGMMEIVDDDSGILVTDYGNPESFAAAMRKMAQSPSLYRRLREGALKRSELFTWAASAQKFADVYAKVSGGPGSKQPTRRPRLQSTSQ